MKLPIGLQPHTIRFEMQEDYWSSLEKVAQIGYKGVELSPPEHVTATELKSRLDRLGLQVMGCHIKLDILRDRPETVIDYLHRVGGRYAGLSSMFKSREEVIEKARLFNRIGETLKKAGIQLVYHNHNWEFNKFDGESAYDILLNETDPELVKMELDTYWVKRGGEDPVAYLKKLNNRCPLLHIKDMEPGEEQFFAEIGEGILDFAEIAAAASEAGTEWLIVEQDKCRRPPFESIEISYRNLKKLNLA